MLGNLDNDTLYRFLRGISQTLRAEITAICQNPNSQKAFLAGLAFGSSLDLMFSFGFSTTLKLGCAIIAARERNLAQLIGPQNRQRYATAKAFACGLAVELMIATMSLDKTIHIKPSYR